MTQAITTITNQILKLTRFEITVQSLKDEVAKTKSLTVDDLEDQDQLSLVKRARVDLRKIEIEIEKTGKKYRDIFNQTNKDIMEKQKELLAITNPELSRLKSIENEAEEIATRKERLKIIPYRKEQLKDFKNIVSDEELLDMDDNQFDKYLIDKTSEKAEQIRIKKEKMDAKKAQEKAIKKAREEERKQAEQDKKDAVDAEKQRQKDIEDKRIADEKAEKELVEANNKALEKNEKYQAFLKKHGCNEDTKKEFHMENLEDKIVLYKKVGELIK